MATEFKDLTPNRGDGQDPNPQGGTDNLASSGNDAPNEAPSQQSWEDKFKASSREAQRLYQENRSREQAWLAEQARYNAELALLRQQQATSHGQDNSQGHVNPKDFWSKDEAKAFSNAVIDQNEDKINALNNIAMERAAERAEQRFYEKLQSSASQVSRNQALAGYLQSLPAGATDPNSPVNQRLVEKYAEIDRDPRYAHLPRNPVNFGTAQAPNWVDPTILTLAGEKITTEYRPASGGGVRQDTFTEPSNRPAGVGTGGDDAQRLMTPEERGVCDQIGMKYSDWMKYEKTMPERRRQGKPVAPTHQGGPIVFHPTKRQ